MRLVGHTDLVGTAAYNHKLGLDRARAVQQALSRYRQAITSFETEAKQGIDLDIKKWAAGEIGRLERHEKLTGSFRRPRAGS